MTTERREAAAHALERKTILHGLDMMRDPSKTVAEVDAYLISAFAVAEAARTGEVDE